MSNITIKRLGGLGDVILALSIAKSLFNRGYSIDFNTGEHLTSFIKCHDYINRVNEINTDSSYNIDFDGIEHDQRFCYTWIKNDSRFTNSIFPHKDPTAEIFVRYVNSILGNGINRSELDYDVKYPFEHRNNMMNYLNGFPKPWIMINTTASISNRSVPFSTIQDVQSSYNGDGTIFWIGNKNRLVKNNIVDVFGSNLFYYIAAIDCCDILVTSNTSSLHFGFAFNKNIVSIEQSWYSKDYSYNTKSNVISINVDLSCINCQLHGGCVLDNKPEFNIQWNFSTYPKCSNISSTQILESINKF